MNHFDERVVHHHSPAPSSGTAALLEVLLGLCLQTFGIGHIYAGHVGRGLLLMFAYWILQAINYLLIFALVGCFTMPLTWLLFIILSPIAAANSCPPSSTAR